MDKWISVEDRLPENNQYVLVFKPSMRTMGSHGIDTSWYWTNRPTWTSEFSHWMPLPEPPK